jgi:hypothetical protein
VWTETTAGQTPAKVKVVGWQRYAVLAQYLCRAVRAAG